MFANITPVTNRSILAQLVSHFVITHTGCIQKNESWFLLKCSGNKAAKSMLAYFLLKFWIQTLFWAISGSQDIDPGFFNFKMGNVDIEGNIVKI